MSPRPLLPPRLTTTLLPSTTIARSLQLWPSDAPQPAQPDEAIETIQAASITTAIEAESAAPAPDSPALTDPDLEKGDNPPPGQATPESQPVKTKAPRRRKQSAATRAKISQARKGHPTSVETRAKLSAANKGRPLTAEHRAKIGQALKGRSRSAETRAKISGERNPNVRHGAYAAPDHPIKTIEGLIDDLSAKQEQLSTLLDQELDSVEADIEYVIRLFSLHGQGASRIARLLRLQQAQAGTPQDQLSQAINQALDELSEEWGVDLGCKSK